MERWAGAWVGDCLLRYDENSCHFNSICSVPGSVLSSFHRVACFILKTALGCSYNYDPHATDGETEAWGERVACLRLQSSKVCALSLCYDLPLNGCLVDFFPSTLYYDTFQTYRKKKFFLSIVSICIKYLDETVLTFWCIRSIISIYVSIFYRTVRKYGTGMTIPSWI